MSVIILKDSIVHYEVLGRGRPIIFLHGWLGSWRYWIPSMQSSSIFFRAYAVDFWGFGDTAKNKDNFSLDDQTDLLDSFFDSMGIGKAALVGHGLGAVVALNFAEKKPDAVDRIMAVCPPADFNSINQRFRNSSPAALAEWLLGKTPGSDTVRIEALKADSKAISTSFCDLETWELKKCIQKLSNPCLFVYGMNDPGIYPPLLNGLEILDNHTHYIFFDQSGHFPMLDENSKFHRLLNDFLSLASGENPQQLQVKEEWKRRVR
jgi:pimeloyl-ACP methyl ester carboxylesterase